MKPILKVFPVVLATIIMTPLLVAAERGDPRLPVADSKLLNPHGNFGLAVSDQSFAISPVDVRVEIDGELVVSDYFSVGSQHTWAGFGLLLSKGKHRIHIWSEKGGATLTKEFEFKDHDLGVIEYWYYPPESSNSSTPRQFSFRTQKSPLVIE
jgi:hypothetical protein